MSVRRVLAALLVACACMTSGRPAAAEPMQPVKQWVLDYAEAQCVAYRDYGNAEKPTTLAIQAAPNGETYEIVILRSSPAPEFAEELEGTIDFGQGPIKAWLLHYRSTGTKLDVYRFRITGAEIAQARTASSVTLHTKGDLDFAFALKSMPQLLDGLAACSADLRKYWNFDGDKDETIATKAKGDVRGVFSEKDYPWEAMSRGQEGTAQYLLLIDETGSVAGCHVEKASGVPALDAMGCIAIQKRAKFTPALDAQGKPVRSAVVTPPITWRLEG